MKYEIDLSPQMFENMKDYAAVHDLSVSELIGALFFENCQEPTSILGKIKANNEEAIFEEFTGKLLKCLDTAASDDTMLFEVTERLKKEHITKPSIISDLYEVYKNGRFKQEGTKN